MNIKDTLKKADIFSGLSKDELGLLADICEEKVFDEREEIFLEGDTSRELYILAEGRVVIEIHLKIQSEKASVHTVSEGQAFGEVALVDGNPRSATATAVKKSSLLIITKGDIEKLIEKEPHIGYVIMKNFSKLLCSRVRKSTNNLKTSLMWG